MNRAAGKVALTTGAARGQGHSHAQRLAEEGADIVALDICADIRGVEYPMASRKDLDETARLVEAQGRRAVVAQVDVRDQGALEQAVADARDEFGRIDIVVANAGIAKFGRLWEISEEDWNTSLDIMLKGAWRTIRATVPTIIDGGRAGFDRARQLARGTQGPAQPRAVLRFEVRLFRPDLDRQPTDEEFAEASQMMNVLPVPWVEAIDVSNAILWLSSDEARYVTGLKMTIDAGASKK